MKATTAMRNIVAKISDALSVAKADVEGLREAIEETKAAIVTTESAPLPIEIALERFEKLMVDRQHEAENAVHVRYFAEATFPAWQFRLAEPHVLDGVLWSVAADAIRTSVRGRLEEFYAQSAASPMTDAARNARLTELKAKLRELERREEEAIVAAEAAGVSIARRADVRPEVFLEIADRDAA